MKDNSSKTQYILLALLCLSALAACFSGSLEAAGLFDKPLGLLSRLLSPLLRATVFIAVGVLAGLIIEMVGWTNRLAVIARPFMRWGHLSAQMGAAFTTAFVSGTASLSMVRTFYEEGRMDRRELISAVLLNTFPSFFLHLPRTFFVLLALAGRAGATYILLSFFAAVLRFVLVLCFTRFFLPEPQAHDYRDDFQRKGRKALLHDIGRIFLSQLARILIIVLPVYLSVVFFSEMGFFLWLRETLARFVNSTFIPVEAMSVVIFSLMTEFTSGYAAAGAMMESGALNVFQTVTALVLGYIIASPIRALRHQMPYYMGIFNPSLGIRLMVFSQMSRVGSMMVIGSIYVVMG